MNQDLRAVSVVELDEMWRSAWDASHRRPRKNAKPEQVARQEAAAADAGELLRAIEDEMQRRRDAYLRIAGARVDALPNPYDGYQNGLYETQREGYAAYIIGIPEDDAMAHHDVFFREAYNAAMKMLGLGMRMPENPLLGWEWKRRTEPYQQTELFT